MKIQQTLMAGLLAMQASAVMAGGPDMMAAPVIAPVSQATVYVNGAVGYGASDWLHDGSTAFARIKDRSDVAEASQSHARDGFVWGGDIGYQWSPHFGLELGAYDLATAKIATVLNRVKENSKIDSWLAYTAATVTVPLQARLGLFGKFGLGYREASYTIQLSGATVNASPDYIAPVMAVGLCYDLADRWSASLQYLHMSGNKRTNTNAATLDEVVGNIPAADLFTVALGYSFHV